MGQARVGKAGFFITCLASSLLCLVCIMIGFVVLITMQGKDYNILLFLGRLAYFLSIGLAYAIAICILGVFIFLSTGFAIARTLRAPFWGYALVGGFAGFAHLLLGDIYDRFWWGLNSDLRYKFELLNQFITFSLGFIEVDLRENYGYWGLLTVIIVAGTLSGAFAAYRFCILERQLVSPPTVELP